jgi:hypothetical protein
MLSGHKRVYVLAAPVVDPASLVPPLPEDQPRHYLAARAPQRGLGDLSFFLEKSTTEGCGTWTFVTSRTVRQTMDVGEEFLTAEGRAEFDGAALVARYDVNVRCYDHIVDVDGTYLLLLDAPKGVDKGILSRDEVNYASLLRERLGGDDALFIDLFPAVDRIWRDKNEGIVNSLEFLSNHMAQIRGKFSLTSEDNYREQPFQLGGEAAGAQVDPYSIAVKWPARDGKPMVVLPGRPEMVIGQTAPGGWGPALSHMLFPSYVSWADLRFVLDRVLQRVDLGAAT